MIATTQNYYEMLGEILSTVHRMFALRGGRVEIMGGQCILVEGDLELHSLRGGKTLLKKARKELEQCTARLVEIEEIHRLFENKDIHGEHRAAISDRMRYVSALKEAMSKTVHFLDLNKILENEAYNTIHELAGMVSGSGEPAPPITITIIL